MQLFPFYSKRSIHVDLMKICKIENCYLQGSFMIFEQTGRFEPFYELQLIWLIVLKESIAKFGVRESPEICVLLHFRPLQTHITTPKYNPNYAPKHPKMHDVNPILSPFLVTLPPQKELKVFFLHSYKCLTVSETIWVHDLSRKVE